MLGEEKFQFCTGDAKKFRIDNRKISILHKIEKKFRFMTKKNFNLA